MAPTDREVVMSGVFLQLPPPCSILLLLPPLSHPLALRLEKPLWLVQWLSGHNQAQQDLSFYPRVALLKVLPGFWQLHLCSLPLPRHTHAGASLGLLQVQPPAALVAYPSTKTMAREGL